MAQNIHFQVIDGNIVFPVSESGKVVKELESFINEVVFKKDGYNEDFPYKVFFEEKPLDDEDPSSDTLMVIEIAMPDLESYIWYGAKTPTLVWKDGNYKHVWDLRLVFRSDDGGSELESCIIEGINALG